MSEKSQNTAKNKGRIPAIITLALSAFLAVGVMALFHACGPKDDGTWMSCHYAQMTVFGLGLAMTVLSLISLFVKSRAAMIFHICTIACAVLAAVIPGNLIRLCMMNEMRCRAVMRPSVILFSILVMVFSVWSIAAERKQS